MEKRKNITDNLIEEVRKIIPDGQFTNLFIQGYFFLCYGERKLKENERDELRNLVFRMEFVQPLYKNLYKNPKSNREEKVTDHIVCSAFVRIIFLRLRSPKSVELHNVLSAIFFFNSEKNLQLLKPSENAKKAGYEKKLLERFDNSYEEYKQNPQKWLKTQTQDPEFFQYVKSIKPVLLELRDLFAGHSAPSMIEWILGDCECLEEKDKSKYLPKQQKLQTIVLEKLESVPEITTIVEPNKSTVLSDVQGPKVLKDVIEEVQNILENVTNEIYIEVKSKCVVQKLVTFEKSDLNVKLFMALIFGEWKKLKEIIELFEV